VIISKPQTSTLLSFAFFLVLTFSVLTLNLIAIIQKHAAWYNYLIAGLLVPIGLFVLYKIFFRYKVISMGNNQIEVRYPVLNRSEKYSVKSVVAWRENIIKTGKQSTYKQLEILFENQKRLGLGQKEHTEYARLIHYLQQKIPGKKTAGS
jgi:Zn-dependent protease with chaperone function